MKLYEFRETDAFGDSYSYYIHAENIEEAKNIAFEKGLTIEQLVEVWACTGIDQGMKLIISHDRHR